MCIGMRYVKGQVWWQRVTRGGDSVVLFLFGAFFRRGEWKDGSRRTVGLPVMDRVLTTTVRLEYKYTSIDDNYVFSF